MGCDIHNIVEVKRNGEWHVAQNPLRKCWHCDGAGKYGDRAVEQYRGKQCLECKGSGKHREEFYEGRNYRLFSILANVRNYHAEHVTPICEPRGIPRNASAKGRRYMQRYGEDGHSHTYHTLQDLLDFDWDQTVRLDGIVSAGEYKAWKAKGGRGFPEAWSGGVGGPRVKIVSNKEMDEYILRPDANLLGIMGNGADCYYTKIEWTVTYREAAGPDWWETVELMKALGDPKEVRILMFFDN